MGDKLLQEATALVATLSVDRQRETLNAIQKVTQARLIGPRRWAGRCGDHARDAEPRLIVNDPLATSPECDP